MIMTSLERQGAASDEIGSAGFVQYRRVTVDLSVAHTGPQLLKSSGDCLFVEELNGELDIAFNTHESPLLTLKEGQTYFIPFNQIFLSNAAQSEASSCKFIVSTGAGFYTLQAQIRAPKVKTLTIANGGAVSGELDTEDLSVMGIIMPAAWTAADLGIQVTEKSGGTFVDLADQAGNRAKMTNIETATSQGRTFEDDALALAPWRYMRFESINTSGEAAVNQGAARTLIVLLK